MMPDGASVVGKPFPRPCARCRSRSVWPATLSYQGTIRYDNRLYTVTVPELVVPRCQACGELHFDNYADDQVNRAFRAEMRLLTPEQIRTNRMALGLSAGELAARLGVEEGLVGRWEEDRLMPSRAQDNLLRLFFALPQVRAALADFEAGRMLGGAVSL
jgi:DNA-binding transcriptional regulator YiaG